MLPCVATWAVAGFALGAAIGAELGRASGLGLEAAAEALGLALLRVLPRGEVARGEARGEAFSPLGSVSFDLDAGTALFGRAFADVGGFSKWPPPL